jgi:hypothetical protein
LGKLTLLYQRLMEHRESAANVVYFAAPEAS